LIVRTRPRFGPPVPSRQVPPLLKKANVLFEQGKYKDAAHLFEELAEKATARNLPPAPHLYVRSGRAYLLDGNINTAVSLFIKGFSIFASQKRWGELQRVCNRVIEDLRQQKRDKEANDLQAWVKNHMAESEASISEGFEKKRPPLPLKCDSCGAAIHPDEVEWIDDNTIECNYCGNMIRGE